MSKARMERIARKLRKEAESFIDYRAIEDESESLGFSTSVRTLRFYVSEGVLPPPRRQGKTPVYPRDWILNALLAIHLMKTRLRRSLGEIKRVVQNLNESPELLAEKCTQLYDLIAEPGSLSQAEARQLSDRFFENLLDGQRQPSEVLITELAKEVEGGRSHERGGFGFHYGQGRPASGRSAPQRRSTREADTSGVAAGEPARQRPVAATTGAALRIASGQRPGQRTRTRDRARDLENVFIRNFETAYRALKSVYHPIHRKRCPTRSSSREPLIADEYLRVVEILKEARCFDRELFDSLPLDKSTRFNISAGGLVQKREKLAVIGTSWSPTDDFVKHGVSDRRAGGTDLCRVLDRQLEESSVFYYVGVHSTVGWEPEVTRYLPRGDNYRVAVVEFDEEAGWRVWDDFPPEAAEVARLFDPESLEEKVERCVKRIEKRGELQVRGGFVPVDELCEELDVGPDVFEEGLKRIARPGNGLEVTTVRGQRLVKRARLSG